MLCMQRVSFEWTTSTKRIRVYISDSDYGWYCCFLVEILCTVSWILKINDARSDLLIPRILLHHRVLVRAMCQCISICFNICLAGIGWRNGRSSLLRLIFVGISTTRLQFANAYHWRLCYVEQLVQHCFAFNNWRVSRSMLGLVISPKW